MSWTEVDGHFYLVINKQRVPLMASFKERQLKSILEEDYPGVVSGAGANLIRIVDCEGLDQLIATALRKRVREHKRLGAAAAAARAYFRKHPKAALAPATAAAVEAAAANRAYNNV